MREEFALALTASLSHATRHKDFNVPDDVLAITVMKILGWWRSMMIVWQLNFRAALHNDSVIRWNTRQPKLNYSPQRTGARPTDAAGNRSNFVREK
jgi:hypothetical protein